MYKYSCDKIFNTITQVYYLEDLHIASQSWNVNDCFIHVIGNILENVTCHKLYRKSVVDYAVAEVHLLKSVVIRVKIQPIYLIIL